jgi:pimeloyl-ACP methyl ester carboxylesterase
MTRHFVRVGERQVHYRRWGEGPAVLVLHGSPQSSRAVEAVARVVAAQGLCAIAPDTPGNGLSAPLPGQPNCADFADALAAFADALGLARLGLYGFHTGASIACAFAALYPERAAAIVFNGLSAWTEAESSDLPARYLPLFRPAWDGSHMTWVWARLEEHTVFFPWYERTPAARMIYDVPSPEATHVNCLDFLESGDGYRAPYAAAFAFRTEAWFHRVKAPFLLASTGIDPLRPHLDRPPLNSADPQIFDDPPALHRAAASLLARHPGDVAPPPVEGGERGFAGGIAWTGRREGRGRPLLLLHEAGGSSRRFAAIMAEIASTRPVLALDLPGHGESAGGDRGAGIDYFADGVWAAMSGLGLNRPAIAGYGFGALVAHRLSAKGAAHAAGQVGRPTVSLDDAAAIAAPSLTPEWDGAHLVRAFRIARWERLFAPWYRRDRTHAIPQGDLDPDDIHARALELIKAGSTWIAAVACQSHGPTGLSLSRSDDPADWREALRNFAAD